MSPVSISPHLTSDFVPNIFSSFVAVDVVVAYYAFSSPSQAEKVSLDGARIEYVKAYAGASGALHNLQVVEEERQKQELDRLVKEAEAECRGAIDKPWKVIPEVTRFNAQFDPGVKLKRRKVLVLDGKSECGKSEFALSMSPAGRAVEINCANCATEPPLQGMYNPTKRDLILCDEMSVELLIANKRLFQGPPAKVILGSAQTNRFTYQAFVFRKRFVICSNKWKQQLEKASAKDREWAQKNTLYVKVREPLWVQ